MGKPLQGASSLAFYLRAYFSTHAFARLFFTQTEAPYKGFPIPSRPFTIDYFINNTAIFKKPISTLCKGEKAPGREGLGYRKHMEFPSGEDGLSA